MNAYKSTDKKYTHSLVLKCSDYDIVEPAQLYLRFLHKGHQSMVPLAQFLILLFPFALILKNNSSHILLSNPDCDHFCLVVVFKAQDASMMNPCKSHRDIFVIIHFLESVVFLFVYVSDHYMFYNLEFMFFPIIQADLIARINH